MGPNNNKNKGMESPCDVAEMPHGSTSHGYVNDILKLWVLAFYTTNATLGKECDY